MRDPTAGRTDPQDAAEATDEDEVRADPDYRGDAPLDYPPERPVGSLAQAITPLDEEVGETAAERAGREEPDVFDGADDGGLDRFEDVELDPGVEEDIAAEVAELIAGDDEDEAEEEGLAVGEIFDPDADVDGEPSYDDAEADEVGLASELQGDEPAEEAAMHFTEAPPWRRRDGYV